MICNSNPVADNEVLVLNIAARASMPSPKQAWGVNCCAKLFGSVSDAEEQLELPP
jgi:hypothetical protein